MTTTLTEEMRRALAQGGHELLIIEDPQTKDRYVLVPKAEYDRIRALIGDETIADSYALQEAVARNEGWDDPLMDQYDNYDQFKKSA